MSGLGEGLKFLFFCFFAFPFFFTALGVFFGWLIWGAAG